MRPCQFKRGDRVMIVRATRELTGCIAKFVQYVPGVSPKCAVRIPSLLTKNGTKVLRVHEWQLALLGGT